MVAASPDGANWPRRTRVDREEGIPGAHIVRIRELLPEVLSRYVPSEAPNLPVTQVIVAPRQTVVVSHESSPAGA